jgi:hypothetical protein
MNFAGQLLHSAHTNLAKWFYRGGRPNRTVSFINRCWAGVFGLGIAPNYLAALEVRGRKSGRRIILPVVIAVVGDQRYLVSMLGEDVAWVRNARAAGGNVILRHGRREQVHLEEVPSDQRAPIIKDYLQRAPGARPHIPVDKDAPVSEFEKVSSRFPVFRIVAKGEG